MIFVYDYGRIILFLMCIFGHDYNSGPFCFMFLHIFKPKFNSVKIILNVRKYSILYILDKA